MAIFNSYVSLPEGTQNPGAFRNQSPNVTEGLSSRATAAEESPEPPVPRQNVRRLHPPDGRATRWAMEMVVFNQQTISNKYETNNKWNPNTKQL